MYTLTLTKAEREAFDWVGDRYATGNEVAELLCDCIPDGIEWGDDGDWNCDKDVEFKIPEHIAWQIKELAEEEKYLWPCFSPELTRKMNGLVERIV